MKEVAGRYDPVLESLETILGREGLIEMLRFATTEDNPRHESLLHLLTGNDDRDLYELVAEASLTPSDLVGVFNEYNNAMALLQARKHLPQILEDMAIDSKSTEKVCEVCRGDGTILGPEAFDDPDNNNYPGELCVDCSGTGKIRQHGRPEARKQLLEALKITGNRQPLVAIQNNTTNVGGDNRNSLLDRIQSALDAPKKQLEEPKKQLSGSSESSEVIESEIVDEDE